MSLFERSSPGVGSPGSRSPSRATRASLLVLALIAIAGGAYWIASHPPILGIEPGEIGLRTNRLTGRVTEIREGGALAIPGIYKLRRYSLRDQIYKPTRSARAAGEAPFQTEEGLSIGVDLTIRYALDPAKLAALAERLPDDIGKELVEPVVQGVIYRIFAQHTVREVFSSQRQEIHQAIEDELRPRLAAEGVILRAVFIGNVDLPADYKTGLEKVLAEELATEKMRFTLDLKEKQVRQTELEAEADKVRSARQAEAEANAKIMEAKSEEEAMQHILPWKQKQIQQRKLEAEAEKEARLTQAEATAEARRIEAAGEADSRRKLAEADAYRAEAIGKVASDQLARDADVITRNPLLIQKTLADKLADKISVIIAPPPESGGFIAAGLIGSGAGSDARSRGLTQAGGVSAAQASTERDPESQDP